METERIGITWQISDSHGWGVFGYNLALRLIREGPCPPLLFADPLLIDYPEEAKELIEPFADEGRRLMAEIRTAGRQANFEAVTILHSLGNRFRHNVTSDFVRGRRNIGFVFFETGDVDSGAIERARIWDRILVGSTWNLERCREAGIEDVAFVSQGVDTERFYPAPRAGVPSGRFVVFSGGKLELRKGQDIVLAAFKRFHARHPDSVLVTAWQNNWAETARTIAESPHVETYPEASPDGRVNIADWAVENDVPADAFVDLGWVANARLPAILRESDIAVFTSRCEGGTNLAAMEAMATGVPTALSANTGHLDIIDGDNCFALSPREPLGFTADVGRHWRETDVDELVDVLERAYADPEGRRIRGARGAEFMAGLSWDNQITKLIDAIEDLL